MKEYDSKKLNLNHHNLFKTMLPSKDKNKTLIDIKGQVTNHSSQFDLMREYNIYLLKK